MLFNPLIFVFGLGIGYFLVTVIKPTKKETIKYPHPENVGKLTYKDMNGICYKYTAEKVSCDIDKEKQKSYPLQN
jgi:hypothetical protein